METTPRISVIIPAYNAAASICCALDSARAQTFPPHEILVIDDGSRDETAAVVSEYADQHPGTVRLLRQENGGPAAARNHGAREATGDWLAFLDADDSWLPQKLETQVPQTKNPRVGVVHCWHGAPPRSTFETLWEQNVVITSTTLVRRSAFEGVGGFDEDRAVIAVEDYNLWLRMADADWEIVGFPEEVCVYTPAEGSLTRQTERFARAELANVVKIAALLNLEKSVVQKKRLSLYDNYGRELLHQRQMQAARRLLTPLLREKPSPARLGWWLATFAPAILLNSRRRHL